jgi:hypothetical protein
MKQMTKGLLVVCVAATSMVASAAQAILYNVNRTFTDGVSTATLIGTIEIPTGHYTIENASVSPFIAVDLTIGVDSASYNLTNVLTDTISGTGQFFIDATPTTLTFSTANSDGTNPADLAFSDSTEWFTGNRYAIGSDEDPGFEAAFTDSGNVIGDTSLPTVFGTAAVPEPGSTALISLGCMICMMRLRRNRHSCSLFPT